MFHTQGTKTACGRVKHPVVLDVCRTSVLKRVRFMGIRCAIGAQARVMSVITAKPLKPDCPRLTNSKMAMLIVPRLAVTIYTIPQKKDFARGPTVKVANIVLTLTITSSPRILVAMQNARNTTGLGQWETQDTLTSVCGVRAHSVRSARRSVLLVKQQSTPRRLVAMQNARDTTSSGQWETQDTLTSVCGVRALRARSARRSVLLVKQQISPRRLVAMQNARDTTSSGQWETQDTKTSVRGVPAEDAPYVIIIFRVFTLVFGLLSHRVLSS